MTEEMFAVEDVCHVGDQELIARLRRMVRVDQALSARLLVHLGEVDARRLYREQAYPSMFAYCVEELRISEAQAYSRIQAARLGRQFPRVLQLLARGEVNMTTIKLLGPHLTAENHVRLLDRARGKRKRGIELLVAEIAPKPDVPSRTRRLPDSSARGSARSSPLLSPTTAATPGTCPLEATASLSRDAHQVARLDAGATPTAASGHCAPNAATANIPSAAVAQGAPNVAAVADGSDAASADCAANVEIARSTSTAASAQDASNAVGAAGGSSGTASCDARDAQHSGASGSHTAFALEAPRARSSSKPLSPGRYKVEFTAGQALHDKLAQLQELLRHQVPDGDLAAIVERAVDLLIDDTMKKRFAQTPRAPKQVRSTKTRSANSRYVPRAVVREVHQRDGGQCTFVSANGKRCSERGFLELHHHDRPYARGGEATVENLRLVCRAHNALFADREYGRTFMRAKQERLRDSRSELVLGASSDVTCSPPTS